MSRGACCDRRSWLASRSRMIVIKIGSAVLAGNGRLDTQMIDELARQIAAVRMAVPGRRIAIVSSGAVAAGRTAMASLPGAASATSQEAKQALAAIGQARLMHAWTDAFAERQVVAAQVLLTRDDFHSRDRFQHAANTFAQIFAWNVLPIINENDTVAVHELKFGDNDTLASLLVNMLEADLFINLTSAPGVFGANPEHDADAPVLATIENIADLDLGQLCGAKTAAGSGGMYSKLLAARRIAQLGVPTLILPGRETGILDKAFTGHNCEPGTWVCPQDKAIPRRKFWLAYQSEPCGELLVDSGAAEALTSRGKSLLPGGITEVRGDFEKGALVRVAHAGETLGVGFSAYGSADLRKIMGRKRHEIAAILGDANYPDAIHRDNLLLNAAI